MSKTIGNLHIENIDHDGEMEFSISSLPDGYSYLNIDQLEELAKFIDEQIEMYINRSMR